ncbi:peptide ABC transporter substrate-binding protein [Actinocrispum sp. NPDC049592]|uniref:peptide ABC transporter substrate-binding protein n=1 Tax=Actinocrispum sp. NPDC049592 TaxID=3154835 RepID=UPI003435CB1E
MNRRLLTAGVAAVALLAASCGTEPTPPGAAKGTVSFALPPNATPNWIFPLGIPGYLASYNSSIYEVLYTPLYSYNGTSGTVAMDPKASAAQPPKYGADGKSVTITLNDLTWSNGQKLTTRDVEFWYNLVKANKSKWGGYAKGRLPDNITGFTATDDKTFTFTLDKAYSPDWFTANQLTNVRPLPQSAWDKTSADGAVGDNDRTEAGAQQVFDFLVSQAKDLPSYTSNPLWKVVDGPFAIEEYSTSGQVTLVRNQKYTGQDKPKLDKVSLKPFTSADAEFNVLQTNGLDYGYLASANLNQKDSLEQKGYVIQPWKGWAITYIPYNFNNPQAGPVFKQLYVRQAIQYAVDQESIAKNIWRDMAVPGYGPIPQDNSSPFLSDTQKSNPYPFDVAKGKQLLESHGWAIGADGVASCTDPGACGPGIAAGTQLKLTLLAESGSKETDNMMAELKSSLSKIGVALDLKQAPLNTVLGNTKPCKPEQPECSWQLSFFGTQGSWYFPAYPSGERIFGTGATSNLGSYTDPKADELISATTFTADEASMKAYSDYLAKQLPVIWLPNPAYQISAIKKNLNVGTQDPLASMQPQRWTTS